MTEQKALHLFEGFGIEIEHMIVDSEHLNVLPITDEVLKQIDGDYAMEVELDDIAWSNELALHVIEMKTNGPAPSLDGLGGLFHDNVRHINRLLGPMGGRLLPTAMHPWMDPGKELKLWPHGSDIIYRSFDRIFGCKGHGWANLQSVHLNLPFGNDAEFGKLHAAIRLVLPIIPSLAASSPVMEAKLSGTLDTRLEIYRSNATRVPSVAGIVIPERVFTRKEYEEGLLASVYRDLAPHDPDGILRHEWVNSRGCIARFDRSAIEIRLIDVQECPQADIAIAAAVCDAVRLLVEERACSSRSQRQWDERELALILTDCIRDGDEAIIDNRRFVESFDFPERGRIRAIELWQYVIEELTAQRPAYAEWRRPLNLILQNGCLARRISTALGSKPTRGDLHAAYERLATCLDQNVPFEP